jgi:hypothetical protein
MPQSKAFFIATRQLAQMSQPVTITSDRCWRPIHRRGHKQLIDGDLSRGNALTMGISAKSFKRWSIGINPIGPKIIP